MKLNKIVAVTAGAFLLIGVSGCTNQTENVKTSADNYINSMSSVNAEEVDQKLIEAGEAFNTEIENIDDELVMNVSSIVELFDLLDDDVLSTVSKEFQNADPNFDLYNVSDLSDAEKAVLALGSSGVGSQLTGVLNSFDTELKPNTDEIKVDGNTAEVSLKYDDLENELQEIVSDAIPTPLILQKTGNTWKVSGKEFVQHIEDSLSQENSVDVEDDQNMEEFDEQEGEEPLPDDLELSEENMVIPED